MIQGLKSSIPSTLKSTDEEGANEQSKESAETEEASSKDASVEKVTKYLLYINCYWLLNSICLSNQGKMPVPSIRNFIVQKNCIKQGY